MQERFYRKGEYLAREGEPSSHLHFIVRGQVELRRNGKVLRRLGDLSVAGGIAALAEDPHGYDIEALADTTTLRAAVEDAWDNFEDHFPLHRGLIQRLGTEIFHLRRQLPGAGFKPTEWQPGGPMPRELDLVGRMAALRNVLTFAGSNVEALADLAKDIEEVRFDEPTHLWDSGDPSTCFYVIRHGVVRGRADDGETLRFGPGDTAGSLESTAGLPRWYDAATEGSFLALRIERDAIFDVLEDHFQFARRMTTALASFMLQLMEQNAPAPGTDP